MTRYQLQDDQGHTVSTHDSYEAAVTAAEEWAGEEGVVGHDGDLSECGDRTLIWASEEESEDDAGANAIGSIRLED